MGQESDGTHRKDPRWLFLGSLRAAYALAGLWLVVSVLAAVRLILADTVGVRWALAGQLIAALVLAGFYVRSARYNGPRELRPSTSRWGGGRPEERWH